MSCDPERLCSTINIEFGYEIGRRHEKRQWNFKDAHIDMITFKNDRADYDCGKFIFKITNPKRKRQPLKITFPVSSKLVHLSTWAHSPPVYKMSESKAFAHFGLPSRVGLPATAFPLDMPYAVCLNPGINENAMMIDCESTEFGVGIETGPDGISFCFLDGTDRFLYELEFYLINSSGLLECLDAYRTKVSYKGISTEVNKGAPIMWFFDWVCFSNIANSPNGRDYYRDIPDLNLFKKEVSWVKELGVEYAVVESQWSFFDEKFWNPDSSEELINCHKQILDILVEANIKPLMYWNITRTSNICRFDRNPQYECAEKLEQLIMESADNWQQKKVFEKNVLVDINWWTNNAPPVSAYPVEKKIVPDLRCPQWREHICDKIKYMLEKYPQIAGVYTDTWPGGLPIFGKCNAKHDHDFGEHEWWNALENFAWQIRATTKSSGKDKVFMLNDSRMTKQITAASDLILNEDYGPVKDPQRVFWQCFRSAGIKHNSKPAYQFHHWKAEMNNKKRTELFMVFSSLFELQYCIWHMQHYNPGPEGTSVDEYYQVLRDMKYLLNKTPQGRSIQIGENGNVEKIYFEVANKKISVDLVSSEIKIDPSGVDDR